MKYCNNCGWVYFEQVIEGYNVCPKCVKHQRALAQIRIERHSDMKDFQMTEDKSEEKRRARTKVGYNRL